MFNYDLTNGNVAQFLKYVTFQRGPGCRLSQAAQLFFPPYDEIRGIYGIANNGVLRAKVKKLKQRQAKWSKRMRTSNI